MVYRSIAPVTELHNKNTIIHFQLKVIKYPYSARKAKLNGSLTGYGLYGLAQNQFFHGSLKLPLKYLQNKTN